MKAIAVLAVFALAACNEVNAPTSVTNRMLAPSAAAGDMIANETIPITFIVLNACNGEPVSATGTLHTMTEVTTPSNGSSHMRLTNDYTFTGVGQITGAKYQGGAHFVDKEIVNSGAATVFSIEASVHLIAQGNVPNTWLDSGESFTVDANGNITHDNPTFSSRCS